MKLQIEKDAATKLSKEVETLEDAQVFANNGFHVSVEQDDGTFKPLSEILAEQAPAEDAEVKPAAKTTKKK